jgi:hypothetical protein
LQFTQVYRRWPMYRAPTLLTQLESKKSTPEVGDHQQAALAREALESLGDG